MKKSPYFITSLLLTIFYLLIVACPLVPLAMQSKMVAHAVTGECSGDCGICGCSSVNRANRTCCCAKKKQQQAHAHEEGKEGTPDCGKKKAAEKQIVLTCGCPCESGKQAIPSVVGSSEVLPCHFSEQPAIPHSNTTFSNLAQRLTSRYGEPPDPPPKIMISFLT